MDTRARVSRHTVPPFLTADSYAVSAPCDDPRNARTGFDTIVINSAANFLRAQVEGDNEIYGHLV